MPLEDVKAIDIGMKTADGGAALVITDSGATSDPTERLQLLREKIRTYANYINSSEFSADYPNTPRDRVSIRVMCATPPTEEMAKIRAISIKSDKPITVPIVYQEFRP